MTANLTLEDVPERPTPRGRLVRAARRTAWVSLASVSLTVMGVLGVALSVVFAGGTLVVGAVALACVAVGAVVIAAVALAFAALLVIGGALVLAFATLAGAVAALLWLGVGLTRGARSLWRTLERLGRRRPLPA